MSAMSNEMETIEAEVTEPRQLRADAAAQPPAPARRGRRDVLRARARRRRRRDRRPRRRRARHAVSQLPVQGGPDRGDRRRADARGGRRRAPNRWSRATGEALFDLLEASIGAPADDRALFDAVADTVADQRRDPRRARGDARRARRSSSRAAQRAGAVRADIGAIDVLMLVKGVCETARQFQHLGPETLDASARSGPRGDQHGPGRAAAARPARRPPRTSSER